MKILRDLTGALAAIALAVGMISGVMMLSQMPDTRAIDYGPHAVNATADRWSLIVNTAWISAVLLGLLFVLFFLIVLHRETPEYQAWLAQWEAGAGQRRAEREADRARRGEERESKAAEKSLYAARKAAAKDLWAFFKKNQRLLSGCVPRYQIKAFINSDVWGAPTPQAAWRVCAEKIAYLQQLVGQEEQHRREREDETRRQKEQAERERQLALEEQRRRAQEEANRPRRYINPKDVSDDVTL